MAKKAELERKIRELQARLRDDHPSQVSSSESEVEGDGPGGEENGDEDPPANDGPDDGPPAKKVKKNEEA